MNARDSQRHPLASVPAACAAAELTDAQLLRRFALRRDQQAFALLMQRHGPMVLNACRRRLSNRHDVEDAFQATFLVLARKAGSVHWSDSIASWLYLVASRIAARARKSANQRQARERAAGKTAIPAQRIDAAAADLASALDEELTRLPERYRSALVLCCLEGKTGAEAARQLGRPVGTIWYQLAHGRELLRARLASRGFALSTVALGTFLAGQCSAAPVPATLTAATVQGAALMGLGKISGACGLNASVQVLANQMLQSMLLTKLKTAAGALIAMLAIGTITGMLARGGAEATAPAGQPVAEAAGRSRVVAYFAEWSVYDRNYHVRDIPADRITHVNYAFAKISEKGECTFFDKFAAIEKSYPGEPAEDGAIRGNFRQLQLLKKKHPDLRTLLSVGGWTLSGPFSDAALTAATRAQLARSCVQFMKLHGFDGLDIDWEYPVGGGLASNKNRPEDKANYTLLLAELRRQLDAQGETDARRYLLTIAAPAGPATIANFELDRMAPLVDWFNVMAYDFHGSWSERTNFHAALYASSTDPVPANAPQAKFNVDAAVKTYVAAGVPRDKIVVGLPFYGRGWGGVPNVNGGLYQPHDRTVPKGTWEAGVWDFKDLSANYVGKFRRHWHDEAKVPWLYDPVTGAMITYDDAESIRLKAGYVKEQKLGGVMIWELSADDAKASLLNAIHDSFRRD